jgi:HAAS domain-containing protein
MSTTAPNPLIDSYIKQLRARARTLPRGQRDELMQQIQEHLREALPPGSTEVEVRNALDQLGEPDAIVAEQFDRLGIQPARAGKLEWAVIVLLPFGAFLIPILGWVLGVILLWASRVWSPREKLVGTLLVPGGLSAVLFLALIGSGSTCTESGGGGRPTIQHCTSPTVPNAIGIPLLIAFVVAGIATPIFLARRASASRT